VNDETQTETKPAAKTKKSRARKTSTIPTRVYKYGCLPPDIGKDLFESQMLMQWRYRRLLVWIERHRRRRREDVYRSNPVLRDHLDGSDSPAGPRGLSFEEDLLEGILETLRDHKRNRPSKRDPEVLQAWDDDLEALRELYVATRDELRAAERAWWAVRKAEVGRLVALRATPENEAMKQYNDVELAGCGGPRDRRRTSARAAGAICRWAKLANDGGDLFDRLALVEDLARLERLDARHGAQEAGLAHGSYCAAERAVEQSADDSSEPPTPPRYDGEGMISLQIAGGMKIGELMSGDDLWLRLLPQDENDLTPKRPGALRCGPREAARRFRFWMRVGGRHEWVSVRMTLHRPLPEDAEIKWAHVQRHMVGPHERYSVLFAVESKTFVPSDDAHERGTVAIDVGWRRIFDSETGAVVRHRVAYWTDDQGREGELVAPEGLAPMERDPDAPLTMTPRAIRARANREVRRGRSFVGSLEKAAEVRGRRDKEMDEVRDLIVAMRNEPDAPAWFRTATEGSVLWRRVGRFVRLEKAWGEVHAEFRAVELEKLRAWLKHDRHLWPWEAHGRERAIGRRRDAWLVFAVWAARTYSRVVVEETGSRAADAKSKGKGFRKDAPGMRERPRPEEGDDENKAQRSEAHRMAPGELVAAIRKSCAKYGAELDERSPENTTAACSACGSKDWDAPARSALVRQCAGCGLRIDQDANASRNLLALATGKALPTPARSLDVVEIVGESQNVRNRVMGRAGVPKARRRDRSRKAA
jgi:hypothetical protein